MAIDIYKLMEIANKEVTQRIAEDRYLDDWIWGETGFGFRICECVRPLEVRMSDHYIFSYDEDDVFNRTAEEQLEAWIDRWFY